MSAESLRVEFFSFVEYRVLAKYLTLRPPLIMFKPSGPYE